MQQTSHSKCEINSLEKHCISTIGCCALLSSGKSTCQISSFTRPILKQTVFLRVISTHNFRSPLELSSQRENSDAHGVLSCSLVRLWHEHMVETHSIGGVNFIGQHMKSRFDFDHVVHPFHRSSSEGASSLAPAEASSGGATTFFFFGPLAAFTLRLASLTSSSMILQAFLDPWSQVISCCTSTALVGIAAFSSHSAKPSFAGVRWSYRQAFLVRKSKVQLAD